MCLGTSCLIADILGEKRLASQKYVDDHIGGNITKVTSDGLYDGEDATDRDDVVASMKYLKANYVKDDDFDGKVDARVDDAMRTNESYKQLVTTIVKEGLSDTGAATKEAVDGQGERIGEVEKNYVAIGDVVDEDGKALTSKDGLEIPTSASVDKKVAGKVSLSSLLKKDDGDKDNTSDTHFYSAAASNARFVVVDDFDEKVVTAVSGALTEDEKIRDSIEKAIDEVAEGMDSIVSNGQLDEAIKDLENVYRKKNDFSYVVEGKGEETLAFQSYVDGKFTENNKEKYLLASNVKGVDESDEDTSVYNTNKVNLILKDYAKVYDYDGVDEVEKEKKKVARVEDLEGYVKIETDVVKKEEGEKDDDSRIYSAAAANALFMPSGCIVNDETDSQEMAYSASYVESTFAKKAEGGKDFLTTANIDPDTGETTSSATLLPTSQKAKKLAEAWFNENYVVV